MAAAIVKNGAIEPLNKCIMMEAVYILEHTYEKGEQDEIKYIGVYSSYEAAMEAIEMLKNKPGFNKYPTDCFKIYEEKLNRTGWMLGF